MADRRGRGEGTLTYDRDADRWTGRLEVARGTSGSRVRIKVTGATQAEARRKLTELRRQHEAGVDLAQRGTTFETLAALWLERGLRAGTASSTRVGYESIIRLHLNPVLGDRRVAQVRPEHVEEALDTMAERGASARSLRLVLGLTRRILTMGERRGLVIRNAAGPVEAPPGPTRLRHGLTVEQAQALLTSASRHRLGNLFTISLLLGLRPGEAAGLTWGCVNYESDSPTVQIEASLRREGRSLTLSKVKTPTSRRRLALPPACVAAFADQRYAQDADLLAAGSEWANEQDLVFTTEVGTPVDPSNVRRDLHIVARRAGLAGVHPHLLRHAAASLLSATGVPLEDISDTLGHRSIAVTAEIYRHPIAPVRSGHLAAMTALTAR
ncbi:MAG: tyrosine-type recombinase/integrase [Sporichthyaceae bacterium]